MKKTNSVFSVEFSSENGGLESLVLNADDAQMNWIEGFNTWGIPLNLEFPGYDEIPPEFEFKGMEETPDGAVSRYQKGTLGLTVERRMTDDALEEVYTFENTGFYDLYYHRGELSIFATFNDDYPDGATCMTQRCNAHIYCGGELSYIHAMKMGQFPTDVALVLTQGALDTYSVRRLAKAWSNDRGDFLLHPVPFKLMAGEKYTLAWKLVALPYNTLADTLVNRFGYYYCRFKEETVFQGESFQISIELPSEDAQVAVSLDGTAIPVRKNGRTAFVDFKPVKLGEHAFQVTVNGRSSIIKGLCVTPLKQLVEKRIRFILDKQQMNDPASPLYGAFLSYDNEEKSQYFNFNWADQNSSAERLGMSLLILYYIRHHYNKEMHDAVLRMGEHITRELFDTETGEVFRGIRRYRTFARLYNTSGMARYWSNFYYFDKDRKYLEWMERGVRQFYAEGGDKFYAFSPASLVAKLLREAGEDKKADELIEMLRRHVKNICEMNGNYPAHEVHYEQTIVAPAVMLLCDYYTNVEKNDEILKNIKIHLERLERFNGDQPDYHLNTIAIRHWDEYWFGKRHLYGDTMPHYLSVCTANCFEMYAKVSGDASYIEKARKIYRNNLCFFNPDGTASCAYLFPFSVTMMNEDGTIHQERRLGEFFDPLANDQDGALSNLLINDEDFCREQGLF